MKKRVIASILAAAMVVSSLAACGGNSGSGTTGGSSASGNSGASAESGAAESSGVITDNFANVDTNGLPLLSGIPWAALTVRQWITW